ncbi:MAG TPA: 3-hydroxyacyl-CoA dehydrogenase NAD-binding domain-containing protein, partial [Gemmataceae bacterium]|nr:3-hydroxyacyl-CoA dehydrogenase NAD-binding domain-containing protein [Gemmataceae bacterium]
ANILSQPMLLEFEQVLGQLKSWTHLHGLTLRSGKPGMFIAGADLKELGSAQPPKEKSRRGLAIVAGFESLPYPTVAVIDGSCLGGGLELALGFDFRVAGSHPKCQLGLPETKMGLMPGWGGTQRLSRIVGPAVAAEMICRGEPVNARRALEIGLVQDAVPSERLMEEAQRLLAWARQTDSWQPQRQKKQQPIGLSAEQASSLFARLREQLMAKTKGYLPAPLAALTAIEKGCNLPLSDGLKVETEQCLPLIGSAVSKNLIAVFFLQQKAAKDPGVSDPTVKPREVNRVGVMGAGIMGSGIAGAHIRCDISTMMLDSAAAALEKGVANIAKLFKGRDEPEASAAINKLTTTTEIKTMADREVVIEAVVENEIVKTQTYRELQSILSEDAILASNTSTISITRMAAAWKRPESFAGMHFFNPVDRMKLVEIVRGEKTSDAMVATLVALARKIGKTPIVVRDCPGFLVNRVYLQYINEALAMLEEGADARIIDAAATAFGMPMGPIALKDLVGLDTSLFGSRVVNAAYANRAKQTRILDELVAAGRLGKKSGAGFYNYAENRKGADDPALEAILNRYCTHRRQIALEEITDRLFLPMLTEASRCLTEGTVRDAGDLDLALILGIGFPSWRGGILRWADTVGISNIMDKLKKYEPLGKRFVATDQMIELAAKGRGFFG